MIGKALKNQEASWKEDSEWVKEQQDRIDALNEKARIHVLALSTTLMQSTPTENAKDKENDIKSLAEAVGRLLKFKLIDQKTFDYHHKISFFRCRTELLDCFQS